MTTPNDYARLLLIPAEVWVKGHEVPGMSSLEWRYDDFGHLIRYQDYGEHSSPHGWEVDHIVALAIGGSDTLDNKRPLHCSRNRSLGGILGGLLGER